MIKYSIVVPVYNSAPTLDELYNRVKRVFEITLNEPFEMILVDDSSHDNSFAKMTELSRNDSRIVSVQLAQNFGQHNALLCGFSHARGDYIITIDDDLQHPPEEIPKLIAAMEANEKIDVVIGKYETKKHSLIRNIGSKVINGIARHTNEKTSHLDMTSFRLIKRFVIDYLLEINIRTPRIGYLITAITDKIVNVTVQHDERKYGHSQYTFKRLVNDFKVEVLSNTVLPLIIVRDIGILLFFISIVMSIIYLIKYFSSDIDVLGWTTLVILLLLFFGVTLFSIGIIGEYLMRIIGEAKKIPNYFERKKIN